MSTVQSFRVVMAQLDLKVGDIAGNQAQIVAACTQAREQLQADVIVFPELTLTGYPPEDLLLRPGFLDHADTALAELQQQIHGIAALIGHPQREHGRLYNSASVLADGQLLARYHKRLLPNYAVFDEKRYFSAGEQPCIFHWHGVHYGISICEDVWQPAPLRDLAAEGAQVVLNLNASPYHRGKGGERLAVLQQRVSECGLPIIYTNLVGGQDELVFDGGSLAVDAQGQVQARAAFCAEALALVEGELSHGQARLLPGVQETAPSDVAAVYRACVLGTRDYVQKNGFPGVILGLSGGIDSAVVLAIAVDALGPERVLAVSLPSRYTADMSNSDAELQARAMGVEYRLLPIEQPFAAFLQVLEPYFAGLPLDTTEENIQARCRGVLLMALSNKSGRMVLTTSNKSETAVGYSTLYGDMAGGFAPIKDVPKTLVYQLANYRNQLSPVIPQRVIDRPPSAELRPDQTDQDSLPAYDILDAILERYVEHDQSVDDLVAAGFERAVVEKVTRLVIVNEYKRRQAAPGVRITPRAFGRDRRYPITSGFRR